MSYWGQLSLPDFASSAGIGISLFHDTVMILCLILATLVPVSLAILITCNWTSRQFIISPSIEALWTCIPMAVLFLLAFPSLRLLYASESTITPNLTFKAIGHQWYWSYEIADLLNLAFDSYLVTPNNSSTSSFRLLEVDNRLVLPYGVEICALITSSDVLHSWAVPSLGVKADAVPGRLNRLLFDITRPGVFYGQCSELCGAGHSFMPIAIEALSASDFLQWLEAQA